MFMKAIILKINCEIIEVQRIFALKIQQISIRWFNSKLCNYVGNAPNFSGVHLRDLVHFY